MSTYRVLIPYIENGFGSQLKHLELYVDADVLDNTVVLDEFRRQVNRNRKKGQPISKTVRYIFEVLEENKFSLNSTSTRYGSISVYLKGYGNAAMEVVKVS